MRTMPRHDGAQRQRAMRARAAWSNNPRRPALPKSVAARNLEGLVVRDRDRQDRVALVEGDGVRPADRDAQRSVLVGDAHGTLVEGETTLRRLLEDVLLDAVGALVAVQPGVLLDGLAYDVLHLVVGVDRNGARVERVHEADRDQEPERDLHGVGK